MRPLRSIVALFVNTFGITRPTPQQEARAGWIILAMLVAVALLLALVALVLHSALVRP